MAGASCGSPISGSPAFAPEVELSDLRSGISAYMAPERGRQRGYHAQRHLFPGARPLRDVHWQAARRLLIQSLGPRQRSERRHRARHPSMSRRGAGRRPSSALSVAMAMPGADPIAAALAAGRRPRRRWLPRRRERKAFPANGDRVLCGGRDCRAHRFTLSTRASITGRVPLPIPPDALAFRAQEILRQLGYKDLPRIRVYGFSCCSTQRNVMLRPIRAVVTRCLAATDPRRSRSVPATSRRVFLLGLPIVARSADSRPY